MKAICITTQVPRTACLSELPLPQIDHMIVSEE
jgi:hypothetical protein